MTLIPPAQGLRRNIGIDDEIIDDSEPERAEIRRRQRKEPQYAPKSPSSSKKPSVKSVPPAPRQIIIDPEIIEISSDESSSPHLNNDESNHNHRNVLAGTHVQKNIKDQSSHGFDQLTSTSGTMNLARFAFPASSRQKSISAKSTTIPAQIAPIDEGVCESRSTTTMRPSLEFSNSELDKIFRCVSCDIAWTTRKTATQKMTHIRSCAKKRGLHEKTIRLLVQEQVSNYKPEPKKNDKGKQKELSSDYTIPTKPNTFMEDVVGDAIPKKKPKRQHAETVLASVSSTRDTILARAKDILNTSTLSLSHLDDLHDLGLFPDDPDSGLPGSTQPFGQSFLAVRQTSSSNTLFFPDYALYDEMSVDNIENSPVLIQETREVHGQFLEEHEMLSPSAAGAFPPINSVDTPFSSSGAMDLEPTSLIPQAVDTSTMSSSSSDPPTPIASLQTPLKIRKRRSRSLSPCSSLINELSALDISSPTQKPKKIAKEKSPTKRTKAKKRVVFGKEWESHMQESILKDRDLYMRILRFEPVDLNVFWEPAKLFNAPADSKLKAALRLYLDGQAIVYFEAVTWGRQCR